MKKKNGLIVLIACILFSAFSINATAKDKRMIERGMSKKDVMEILGKPKFTNFDQYGEQWKYIKNGNLLDTDNHEITVGFDRNDKVISYQNILVPTNVDQTDDMEYAPLSNHNTMPVGDMPLPQYPYGG